MLRLLIPRRLKAIDDDDVVMVNDIVIRENVRVLVN